MAINNALPSLPGLGQPVEPMADVSTGLLNAAQADKDRGTASNNAYWEEQKKKKLVESAKNGSLAAAPTGTYTNGVKDAQKPKSDVDLRKELEAAYAKKFGNIKDPTATPEMEADAKERWIQSNLILAKDADALAVRADQERYDKELSAKEAADAQAKQKALEIAQNEQFKTDFNTIMNSNQAQTDAQRSATMQTASLTVDGGGYGATAGQNIAAQAAAQQNQLQNVAKAQDAQTRANATARLFSQDVNNQVKANSQTINNAIAQTSIQLDTLSQQLKGMTDQQSIDLQRQINDARENINRYNQAVKQGILDDAGAWKWAGIITGAAVGIAGAVTANPALVAAGVGIAGSGLKQ